MSILIFSSRVRNLVTREEGQDFVEYALVVSLIAFGAIAGPGDTRRRPQQRILANRSHSDLKHYLV